MTCDGSRRPWPSRRERSLRRHGLCCFTAYLSSSIPLQCLFLRSTQRSVPTAKPLSRVRAYETPLTPTDLYDIEGYPSPAPPDDVEVKAAEPPAKRRKSGGKTVGVCEYVMC